MYFIYKPLGLLPSKCSCIVRTKRAKKQRRGYKIRDKSRKLIQSKFETCNFPWPNNSFPLLRKEKKKRGAYLQLFTQSFYSYLCSSKAETKDSLPQQIICCYNRKLHLVQSVSYTKRKLKFPCADIVYSHCMRGFFH